MTTDREKYDQAMLDSLTDEEREGLLDEEADEGEDDDDADAGADGGAADEGDNASDDGDEDDASEDGGDGADQAAADAAAAAAAEAEAAAKLAADTATADDARAEAAGDDQAGADASDDANEKRPAWLDAQDLSAQKTELKQQLAELAKKFDDGDLMASEFNAQREAIEEQREALLKQEIKTETQRDLGLQKWRDDVADFSKDKPQYQPGGILREALDKKVKELQVSAVNPLSPRLLEKAHAEIQKALGLPLAKAETPAPKKDEKPAPAPRRPAPPPTLAHIPATDITDADDGAEFSHLDQLLERDSVRFEQELARLSPGDRDRYLAR